MDNTGYDRIDNKEEVHSMVPNVLVIGDVILDQYISGKCSRISPEAPVPVMSDIALSNQAGGAANVALNLKALGCNVTLMGVTGRDKDANTLQDLCSGFVYMHFQRVSDIPTTLKTRYICDGQQILRIDREKHTNNNDILKYYEAQLYYNQHVVIADYGKHFTEIIPQIIQLARDVGIPVHCDPKSSDWSIYRNVSTITPNLKEFAEIHLNFIA